MLVKKNDLILHLKKNKKCKMKVIFGIFLLIGILFGIAFAADHDYSLRSGAMVGAAIMGGLAGAILGAIAGGIGGFLLGTIAGAVIGLAGAGVATESLRGKK